MSLHMIITGHPVFSNFLSKFWAHISELLLRIFEQDVLQVKWGSNFRDIQNGDKYWRGFNSAYKNFRSSRSQMFFKIGVLKIFAKFIGKYLYQSLAYVFSFEFCKIFQNTFFYKTPPVVGSWFSKRFVWINLPKWTVLCWLNMPNRILKL